MMNKRGFTEKEIILFYEINSRWWMRFITWRWMQNMFADYYIRKVNRRFPRFREAMKRRNAVKL